MENKPKQYFFLNPDYKQFVYEIWKQCISQGWASQDAREYAEMLWNENKIKT